MRAALCRCSVVVRVAALRQVGNRAAASLNKRSNHLRKIRASRRWNLKTTFRSRVFLQNIAVKNRLASASMPARMPAKQACRQSLQKAECWQLLNASCPGLRGFFLGVRALRRAAHRARQAVSALRASIADAGLTLPCPSFCCRYAGASAATVRPFAAHVCR